MKKILRNLVRKLLNTREHESIPDAIDRRKTKLKKLIYNGRYSKNDLYNQLLNIGIRKGDIVLVHASWREFFNFQGTPEDVIYILEELVGESGTILMPTFGADKSNFDVENTPSAAGVISEVFRKKPNAIRSASPHSSVSAIGKHAYDLTSQHVNSVYSFDENSPYYLLTKYNNSKVLFLGLGKKPTKITLFHCAGYLMKDKLPFYKNIFTDNRESTVIKDGNEKRITLITRNPRYKNDNNAFKKIYKSISKRNYNKISNLDIVLFDAREGLEKAIEAAKQGVYCYKLNNLKK